MRGRVSQIMHPTSHFTSAAVVFIPYMVFTSQNILLI